MKQKPLVFFITLILFSTFCYGDKIVEKLKITGYVFSDIPMSKNMEIVTKKNIRELNINSFTELFSLLTSVNVSRRGAGDTSFDFTLRGSNFEQVLILINGIPFNNPQTGHFNGDFPFSIKDIERVEILKGGSSAIYGGGAFAGIVNIILSSRENLNLSLTGGEHNYFSAHISGGKKFRNFTWRISAHKSNTAGFHEGREYDLMNLFTNAFYAKGSSNINFSAGYLFKDFGAKGFYAPFPSKENIKSAIFQLQAKQKINKIDYILKLSYEAHSDDFILDRKRPDFYFNQSDTTN